MELLDELLPQAVAEPSQLRSQAAGAALALAVHCLMVRDGFQPLEVVPGGAAGRPLKGRLVDAGWNENEHFWMFEYARPGAANKFRLACSLQPHTRRVFIHASEVDAKGEPDAENIRVMGLQLDNYVPAGDACASSASWSGVITNEHALSDMFAEFVGGPLWRHAASAPAGSSTSGSGGGWLGLRLEQRTALVAAAAVAVAAVAALVLLRSRQRGAS